MLSIVVDLLLWGALPAVCCRYLVPVVLDKIWYYSSDNPRRRHYIDVGPIE